MERNPATTNNFGYYKDPMNFVSPNSAYTDLYQLTYPFDDDIKDKRCQLPLTTAGTHLQQVQQSQQQPQPPTQSGQNLQYHQNYSKADYHQQSYKSNEKVQSVINPYANYNYPNYKDNGQYPSTAGYYDQYKFNVSLGTAAANYGKSAKDSNYHQNYNSGVYADAKLGATSYCDDANFVAKSGLVKSTNSSQLPQFPMYANCYGYPTAASFANQNYCSYAQSCNDDARMLWDEYQNNRRLVSSYVPSSAAVPSAPVQASTVPPQASCRLKSNYPTDFYGSSAAYHAYHTAEGMRSREKLMYSMNSHVPSPSENLYNSRSRCLPMDYKYPTMSQNMMIPPYDHRYNYISSDAQAYDYCSQRQDNGVAYHPAGYGKASIVNPPAQKHIRPPAALSNDYYNSQSYYVCNDQMNTPEFQNAYSQQCLRDARHSLGYNVGVIPASRNISSSNDITNKEVVYAQPLEGGAYYTHSNQVAMPMDSICGDKSKSTLSKGQNLREFLATWNEDEDDGGEKMDDSENQLYLQQTNIEVENKGGENHLQFKGSFNTRPKIHVGITVDSNVSNNQYINLPDIIIDIEKPKDTDLISHSIGSTQSGNSEKLVLLESVDVPVTDLSQYANINLLEPSIEDLDALPADCTAEEETAAIVAAASQETVEQIPAVAPTEIPKEMEVADILPVSDDIAKIVEETRKPSTDIKGSQTEALKHGGKVKRRRRIIKSKIADRLKTKCRMLGKVIKTKGGKKIRIRKVMRKMKKRRNFLPKKTMSMDTNMEHSKVEAKKKHSLHNPKTLKDICVCFFNTDVGRDWIMREPTVEDDSGRDGGGGGGDDDNKNVLAGELNQQSKASSVPTLSALCEHALNSFYEEKNILLLNLAELDSNLYFIECDINENVVNSEENSLGESDFVELFIDDEMEGDETNHIKNDCKKDSINGTANVDDCIFNGSSSNSRSGSSGSSGSSCCSNSSVNIRSKEDSNILGNSLAEICLASDENSRDFSAIHHEEIVPDNLHAFENEKLLKYLQSKYIQKSNYLKIFIIDKICKKYRKYILRRRKCQKQQLKNKMTKKFLVSKLKDKFIKRSKDFRIGSCS